MHRSKPETVWESSAAWARATRASLMPLGWLYGAAVSLRNAAFDRGVLSVHSLGVPTVSIGNLTVGGTGKTPVAAWLARRLAEVGAKPAILLRGYGGDELLVHERLNPGIPVVADADRVRGAAVAKSRGATVLVLDDGFQHRRVRRDADIVLLSADRSGPVRSLPAGPWREPLESLARASIVAVTRKNASPLRARELLSSALRYAPGAAGVVLHLAADQLRKADDGVADESAVLSGMSVLAISGIGDPRAFQSQLRNAGARVQPAVFPDHHAFSAGEAATLAARVKGQARAVCTLKDAVKLASIWPHDGPPLWYLSQRVLLESGGDAIDVIIRRLTST